MRIIETIMDALCREIHKALGIVPNIIVRLKIEINIALYWIGTDYFF